MKQTARDSVVDLNVGLFGPPADLETVDALATLQLLALRRGMRIRLREAAPDLAGLLCLCGLERALGLDDDTAGALSAEEPEPAPESPTADA